MDFFIYEPPLDPLSILYVDQDILVVDKPSGLLSVPGKSLEHRDCLETRVRTQFNGVLLVHRLDMDTSGVMIFGLNKNSQRDLSLQFEKRTTEKTYEARVVGVISEDSGCIDLPLIVDWPNRPLQMVDLENGKQAKTDWRVIKREADSTRIELNPKTGRSHQLRVHMLEMGHPIIGDRFYGTDYEISLADRLQLHAIHLKICHPGSGTLMRFTSPVPF